MIVRQIEVSLGDRSYPIVIGRGMLSTLGPTLQQRALSGSIVLITDHHVAPLYLKPVEKHLLHFGFTVHSVVVPAGERQKSLTRASRLYSGMLKAGVGRRSVVIALGGGVIGDLAGFVAATYQRGVHLVQFPTTLLAQVDSSVGGKVAVNHPLGKNMVGAFYQPALVWVDSETLQTLPFREIVCGMGEIVKYGIAFDAEFFRYLETDLNKVMNLEPDDLFHVQSRCLEIKSRIVSEDEKEAGLRALLNFGHTVGHALEAAGDYRVLKHGEAVLLGMICESYIAVKMGMISSETHTRIVELIHRIPLKPNIGGFKTAKVLRAMKYDKKSEQGRVRFVLPTKIGDARTVENVDSNLVLESLKYLRNRNT